MICWILIQKVEPFSLASLYQAINIAFDQNILLIALRDRCDETRRYQTTIGQGMQKLVAGLVFQ